MALHYTPNRNWREMAASARKRQAEDNRLLIEGSKMTQGSLNGVMNPMAPLPTGRGVIYGRSDLSMMFNAWMSAPYMWGAFRFDSMTNKMMVMRQLPWERERTVFAPRLVDDNTYLSAMYAMQEMGWKCSKEHIADAIALMANQFAYDSGEDEILALIDVEPGPEHDVRQLAKRYMGHSGDEPDAHLIKRALEHWFCQGVHRLLDPGPFCKAEMVLAVLGEQGSHKSDFGRALALKREWFSDQLPLDLTKTDAKMLLSGKAIVELPEMIAITANKAELMKTFISVCVDEYRRPYGRLPERIPRRFGMYTTGNWNGAGLEDPTGSRRFYPIIPNGPIDYEGLQRDAKLIWADALRRYIAHRDNDTGWWFSANEEKDARQYRAGFRTQNLYDARIQAFLNLPVLPILYDPRDPKKALRVFTDNDGLQATEGQFKARQVPFKLEALVEYIFENTTEVGSIAAKNRELKAICSSLRAAGCNDFNHRRRDYVGQPIKEITATTRVWSATVPPSTLLESHIVSVRSQLDGKPGLDPVEQPAKKGESDTTSVH